MAVRNLNKNEIEGNNRQIGRDKEKENIRERNNQIGRGRRLTTSSLFFN